MTKPHLLSIIVPTRERPDTLKHCLRTILMQEDPRFEVIVSDNCSGPETRLVVESFQDSRIRYVRPDERLGMSENYEFALQHIKGDWVTIIGDDDGLLPNAVSRFFTMIEGTNVRVVSSLVCGFDWPGVVDKNGRLICLSRMGKPKKEIRETRYYLEQLLHNGGDYKSLPCLYTGGFMRADLIDEIKRKSSGQFYKSKIPDVYSGVAASSVDKKFLYVWEPLAIGGTSRHSNGLQWNNRGIDEAKKSAFIQESTKPFHPSLGSGLVQLLPILIYESYLQASHLRNYEVATSIPEQLALSVLSSPAQRKEDAIEYSHEVCAINDLSYDDVVAATKRLKRKRKMIKLRTKIQRILFSSKKANKHVIMDDPDLATIYDASIRLGQMLKL